ncbi:MAG: dockerin type I repeat-containing protein [Clostridia bacterium]|nr:dockerin type I repeat-containing protein [Clostridia bacterium]
MKDSLVKALAFFLSVMLVLALLPSAFAAFAEQPGDYTGGSIDPATGEPIDPQPHTHTGGTATCHTKAVCEVCGEDYGDYDSANHDGIEQAWSSDKDGHWHLCTGCQLKVGEQAHTLGWCIKTPATEDTDGLKAEYCTVCGYETGKTEVIPATGPVTIGDVNGDKLINNQDLTMLFQSVSGMNVTANEKASDVNGDKTVNNQDIARLFRYLTGWVNSLN